MEKSERGTDELVTRFLPLAWPGTEGRARGERAGTHAEARTDGRRNGAEKVTAAGTTPVAADGIHGLGAEPMTPGFAKWINALHGEAGQVLHVPPSGPHSPGRPPNGRISKNRTP